MTTKKPHANLGLQIDTDNVFYSLKKEDLQLLDVMSVQTCIGRHLR